MVRTKTNRRINKRVKKSSMKKKHKRKSTKRRSLRGGANNNSIQTALAKLDEALVSNINIKLLKLKLKKPMNIKLNLIKFRNIITKARYSEIGSNIPFFGLLWSKTKDDEYTLDREEKRNEIIKSRGHTVDNRLADLVDLDINTFSYFIHNLKEFNNRLKSMPILYDETNLKKNCEIIINYVCDRVVQLIINKKINYKEYKKLTDDLSTNHADALKDGIEKQVRERVPEYNNYPNKLKPPGFEEVAKIDRWM